MSNSKFEVKASEKQVRNFDAASGVVTPDRSIMRTVLCLLAFKVVLLLLLLLFVLSFPANGHVQKKRDSLFATVLFVK